MAVGWLVAGLLWAAPAGAAVTVGSDLSAPASFGENCDPACTFVQTALPGRDTTSPIDGVVVRWRVRDADGSLRLRVVRPSPAGLAGAGTSAAATGVPGSEATFGTRLRVRRGDRIGLDVGATAAVGSRPRADAESVAVSPPLNDDAAAVPPGPGEAQELLLNADVEPDADADGYGDETQDGCPTDRASHTVCPPRLALTVVERTDSATPGSPVRHAFRAQNLGPETARGAVVTLHLTGGAFAPVTATAGSCSAAVPTFLGNEVRCALGALAFGADERVVVTATAEPRAGSITSHASLDADNARSVTATTRTTVVLPPAVRQPAGGPCANLVPKVTDGPDTIGGSPFGDVIFGGAGHDVLRGLAGADCIYGQSGNDSLSGGTGNDRLSGDPGRDRLDGGTGADALRGGTGGDVLIGGRGRDSLRGDAGGDRIAAADGVRETVRCGTGRDSARADRADRLIGCERVTRVRAARR